MQIGGDVCPPSLDWLIIEYIENSKKRPQNTHDDLCDDDYWNAIAALSLDGIKTTVVIELDVNYPLTFIQCLELMKEHNVTILHEESLWNGFKVNEIVQVRLQRVMEAFGAYVDGVYYSNTPNNIFAQYGNVDYFADLILTAKAQKNDFRIAMDGWDADWPVGILTGTGKVLNFI